MARAQQGYCPADRTSEDHGRTSGVSNVKVLAGLRWVGLVHRSYRHTTGACRLDLTVPDVVGCAHVLAGVEPDQPGRVGCQVSAAGAQRAAPDVRVADREVIHWFGRAELVDRAALARLRHVDRAVPEPQGGGCGGLRQRYRGARQLTDGWRVGVGPAVGTPRHRDGDPRDRGRPQARRDGGGAGAVRPGRAAGPSSPAASSRRRRGSRTEPRSRAARCSPKTPPTRRWTSCSTRCR